MPVGGARKPVVGVVIYENAQWTAGAIYIRNLISALASLPRDQRPTVRLVGLLGARLDLVRELSRLDFVETRTPIERNALQTLVYRAVRKSGRTLFGAIADPELRGTDVVFPCLIPDRSRGPQMFWVPDFQEHHFPELFSAGERQKRLAINQDIARQDATLVLSSQAALGDFQKFYPDARITPRIWNFTTTISAAEQGGREPRQTYGLPEKFLYLPNQFWVHKDHATAFRALAILKQRGLPIPLVCTGLEQDHRRPGHMDMLRQMVGELGLSDRIQFLGLVPRNDQFEIFRAAAAVLQTSLFEGWSTVIEDARTVGRPLIVTDLDVHREQCGEAARYFRRSSPEDLARVLAVAWPVLRAGPDLKAEATAAAEAAVRTREAGERFMQIVTDTIAQRHQGNPQRGLQQEHL